jgi:hypothetical protein
LELFDSKLTKNDPKKLLKLQYCSRYSLFIINCIYIKNKLVKLTVYNETIDKKRMVNLRASVRSQKVREELFYFFFIAEKLLEKGYTKLVKRLPQMCTTVQLWVGKGGAFCVRACACACGRRRNLTFEHFSSTSSNISARRQTSQLDFVKHFGAASNISARRLAKTRELINLTMTSTSLSNATHTFVERNAHF